MTETTSAFRWAVIGTGRIANTVAKEITATDRHKITAVYSRTREKAEAFSAKYGAVCCGSAKEAVTEHGADAVYIATPHSSHYPYIMECISLGVPVLCEKSFTVNAEQARAAAEFAEQKGVYLAEGMWTRSNPVVRRIVEWVREGRIGEITSIAANFSLPLSVTKPFVGERVYKKEYAGGALLDLGVYPIAYAHLLLGVPSDIECRSVIKDGADFDDDITLSYASGAKCILNCSFRRLKTYTARIKGTKGEIVSPMFYKPNKAALITKDGIKTARCKRGYIYQFDNIAADIRAGKTQSDLISHKDTIEIMSIMDECRRQAGLAYPDDIEKL